MTFGIDNVHLCPPAPSSLAAGLSKCQITIHVYVVFCATCGISICRLTCYSVDHAALASMYSVPDAHRRYSRNSSPDGPRADLVLALMHTLQIPVPVPVLVPAPAFSRDKTRSAVDCVSGILDRRRPYTRHASLLLSSQTQDHNCITTHNGRAAHARPNPMYSPPKRARLTVRPTGSSRINV